MFNIHLSFFLQLHLDYLSFYTCRSTIIHPAEIKMIYYVLTLQEK